MDLGHERACRIDHLEISGLGASSHLGGDPMSREDAHRSSRYLVLGLDEYRSPLLELFDHVPVMDDLFADVNRSAASFDSALDHLDGAIDPGAIASGGGKDHSLHGLSLRGRGFKSSGEVAWEPSTSPRDRGRASLPLA